MVDRKHDTAGLEGCRLLLIEGVPGSGKTTTAKAVFAGLQEQEIPARLYLEDSPDNPIRTFLTEGHHRDLSRVREVLATGGMNDPTLWTLQQWETLARDLCQQRRIAVMESRFWQMTCMVMLAYGVAAQRIIAYQRSIHDALAFVHPRLVVLEMPDIAAATRRPFNLRTPEWGRRQMSLCEQSPYFQKHHLTGIPGLIRFFEAWQKVACELYADYPYPKLKLIDPQDDWAAAYRQLNAFLSDLRGTPA